MLIVMAILLCIAHKDVLLTEFSIAKSKVSIEIPVLITQRSADARIGQCTTTMQRRKVRMVVSCIGHEACAHGKVQIFLLIVHRNRWL